MKAIGFFYSWSGRRALDAYFGQFAGAFAAIGIELKIILANELLHPGRGQQSFNPLVDETRLIGFVNDHRPDFIFSVNHAGITARLERETVAPIVSWLVDDVPHLFFHDGSAGVERAFAGRERIVCYSSTLAGQIAQDYPDAGRPIGFVSHGTDLAGTTFTPAPAAYPISFVGSCLDYRPFLRLLQAARRHKAAPQILSALEAMREDYVAGLDRIPRTPELERSLRAVQFSWLDFRRTLSDVLTTQNRMEGLRRVADLGLHLFGNDLWLDSLCATSELAARYQFDTPVDSYAKLVDIYARSKISINIPNVQNVAGLAARVFDIMASPSLLITQYQPDSDLFRLFGQDCPVPMYRDFDHLRELCRHFLENEGERLRVVASCNRLIDARFLLRNRLAAMLECAGISVARAAAPAAPLDILPAGRFHAFPRTLERLGPWARLAAGQRARRAVQAALKALPPGLR